MSDYNGWFLPTPQKPVSLYISNNIAGNALKVIDPCFFCGRILKKIRTLTENNSAQINRTNNLRWLPARPTFEK